jgi:hypothetical protein
VDRADRLPVTLTLRGVRQQDGKVGLRWSTYDGADFGSYVVLRDGRTMVARRVEVGATHAVDAIPPVDPARYVVVVLDDERRPVARSQAVRL